MMDRLKIAMINGIRPMKGSGDGRISMRRSLAAISFRL